MSDHMKPQRKAVGRLAESSQATFISPIRDFSPQSAATPQTVLESLTNVQPSSASPEQILEHPQINQTPFRWSTNLVEFPSFLNSRLANQYFSVKPVSIPILSR